MTATISGADRMIRISRIGKNGSPIGCCGDRNDDRPAASVTA